MPRATPAQLAERDMDRCICTPEEWAGRVTTPADDGEASAWVCALSAHREAAERWVRLTTNLEPVYRPKDPTMNDASRRLSPSG